MRREVDGVFEVRAQVRGDFAELLAAGADRVRQRAGEVRQWVDGGGFGAEDVADRAVAAVLAVDVALQSSLVGLELAFEGGVVEVAHPAFGFVDLRALLRGGEQAICVEGDGERFIAFLRRNVGRLAPITLLHGIAQAAYPLFQHYHESFSHYDLAEDRCHA